MASSKVYVEFVLKRKIEPIGYAIIPTTATSFVFKNKKTFQWLIQIKIIFFFFKKI